MEEVPSTYVYCSGGVNCFVGFCRYVPIEVESERRLSYQEVLILETSTCVIEVAKSDELIAATFELFLQLRPHLKRELFVEQVRHMQNEYSYKIVMASNGQEPVAAAGYRITHSLAWGKYLYIDDLIADKNHRRHGHARTLWNWLVNQAEQNNCDQIHLDSGVHRHDAHKYYLKNGMDITCHHFQIALGNVAEV